MLRKRTNKEKEWFESWFDSKYYHFLYQSRDDDEANEFIRRLQEKLQLDKGARILDLCCGKGRHSFILNRLGFKNVHGIDLSPNNIEYANSKLKPEIIFRKHDMRDIYRANYFDVIFNLFTSFGYFTELENIQVLKAVHSNLVEHGKFVLDYFNPALTLNQLTSHENRVIDDVKFSINKKVEGELLVKSIQVEDGTRLYKFEERVQLIDLKQFSKYMDIAGFKIVDVCGNYDFDSYEESISPRIILFAHKL